MLAVNGSDQRRKSKNFRQSVDKQRTMCYYNSIKRTTHNNKREEVQSMTVIIEYAVISPAVLANRIGSAFHCMTNWKDIDEDHFEFSVYGCTDLSELEDVLAEYV